MRSPSVWAFLLLIFGCGGHEIDAPSVDAMISDGVPDTRSMLDRPVAPDLGVADCTSGCNTDVRADPPDASPAGPCDFSGTWRLSFDAYASGTPSQPANSTDVLVISADPDVVSAEYFDELANDCECPTPMYTVDLDSCRLTIGRASSDYSPDIGECNYGYSELSLTFTHDQGERRGEGRLIAGTTDFCERTDFSVDVEFHSSYAWRVVATFLNPQ